MSIQAVLKDTLAAMQKLASDKTLDAQYRRDQIEARRRDGIAQMQAIRDTEFESRKKERGGLVAKTRMQPPSPEQAAQILYVKDSLQARWKDMKAAEIVAEFESAIEAGDMVTTRVYFDFAHTAPAFGGGPAVLLGSTRERAENALLGPEGVKAREKLKELDYYLNIGHKIKVSEQVTLETARIDAVSGQVITGMAAYQPNSSW